MGRLLCPNIHTYRLDQGRWGFGYHSNRMWSRSRPFGPSILFNHSEWSRLITHTLCPVAAFSTALVPFNPQKYPTTYIYLMIWLQHISVVENFTESPFSGRRHFLSAPFLTGWPLTFSLWPLAWESLTIRSTFLHPVLLVFSRVYDIPLILLNSNEGGPN